MDEVKREKRRQKIMKLLAEKEASILNYASQAPDNEDKEPGESCLITESKTSLAGMKSKVLSTPPTAAAGSALAAVRHRSQQSAPEELAGGIEPHSKPPRKESAKAKQDKATAAGSANTAHPTSSAASTNEQKAKLAELLLQLADKKKEKEREKIKLEERKKRRVALLSQRILQEAAERKQMMQEDAPKHQIHNNNNHEDDAAKKVVKKITPEMAEAMAKRLYSRANIPESNKDVAPKDKAVKPPSSTTTTKKTTSTAAMTSLSAPSTAVAKDSKASTSSAAPSSSSTANTRSNSVTTKSTTIKRTTHKKQSEDHDNDDSDSDDSGKEVSPPKGATTSAVVTSGVSTVPARDFNDWKRKNRVPVDGKVFCMTGWYPCVKQALLDRGWHFNPDPSSPYFHLKWTLRSLDVNQEALQPWQLINHYMKNVAITTKYGLLKSLQSLKWMDDVDCNDILPRGYDLSVSHDIQAFLDDFRCQKAENIIKRLYWRLTGIENPVVSASTANNPASFVKAQEKKDDNDDDEDKPEQSVESLEESATQTALTATEIFQSMTNEPVIPPVPPLNPQPVPRASKTSAATEASNQKADIVMINPAVFEAALRMLQNLLKPYDEDTYLDEDNTSNAYTTNNGVNAIPAKVVSDLDWELVEHYDLYTAYPAGLPTTVPEPIDAFLANFNDSSNGNANGDGPGGGVDTSAELRLSHALRREKKKYAKWLEEQRALAHDQIKQLRAATVEDVATVHTLLYRLLSYHGSQYGLNGSGTVAQNLWIVKPASKSRGRGIVTFNDLPKLLKYVQISHTALHGSAAASTQWIVQKYLENPLIIAKRKFDMRQWVLVYDWNPLTIYFYDEFYARFSVEEYSTEELDLSNAYVHLVNNSIGKNSENFTKVVTAENGVGIEGYMWSFADFTSYLAAKNNGRDVVREKIQPRMKVCCLTCVSVVVTFSLPMGCVHLHTLYMLMDLCFVLRSPSLPLFCLCAVANDLLPRDSSHACVFGCFLINRRSPNGR